VDELGADLRHVCLAPEALPNAHFHVAVHEVKAVIWVAS
jgi:hypothetical protein